MASTTAARPVRIMTVSFTGHPEDATPENPYPTRTLDEMVGYIENNAREGELDMILLPEFWPGASVIESLDGEIITTMRKLAAKYHTYIICPISRKTETIEKLNTAVLIDRAGEIQGSYDKRYPFWGEYDIKPAPKAGTTLPVFDVDFGRIAIAICFDANFPGIWEQYGREGVEVVFWVSAYAAGAQLQAHALNNNYYIVTATSAGTSLIYDINGERIMCETAPEVNVCKPIIDLDRGIYHYDFNLDKLPELLDAHGDDIEVEKMMDFELWFILRSRNKDVSARTLAKEYGMTELQQYKFDSQRSIDIYRETGCFPKGCIPE